MMARAMGSKVEQHTTAEVGWFPVTTNFEGREDPVLAAAGPNPLVYHWHNDTFHLPKDAVLLAEMFQGPGTVDEILATFTARRLPRARYVIDSSHQIAAWEMEQWAGIQNPDANPGMLLGQATHKLMEAY